MHAVDIAPGIARRFRAGSLVGLAAAIPLLLGTAFAGTANANHVGCGDTIRSSTTLYGDLECSGSGIIIAADNVKLNLNGHSLSGDPQARAEAGDEAQDSAGVVFRRVTGSRVINGTISDFDSGIEIRGGSRNQVRGVTVRDNINYRILTGANADPNGPGAEDDPPSCDNGDGIAVFNSDRNVITRSEVVNNGPFSGISLVENSDANSVSRNVIANNDVPNQVREDAAQNAGEGTVCGTGGDQGPMTRGRGMQDSGVRIEGPGADKNLVHRNDVTGNGLTGIAIHGYVCNPPTGDDGQPLFPAGENNGGNRVFKNQVSDTGSAIDELADGIATLQQGPAGIVCVASGNTIKSNVSAGNDRHGIFMGGRGSHDNDVSSNRVDNNGGDGLHLEGPSNNRAGEQVTPGAVGNRLLNNIGRGNDGFDGFDGNENPPCDDNKWRSNRLRTVNQSCVRGPDRR